MKLYPLYRWFWPVLLFSMFVLTGCGPQTALAAETAGEQMHAAGAQKLAAAGKATTNLDAPAEATVSFTLETAIHEGRMAFKGVGGSLDGVINPELRVNPGDIVQINLVNGDGAEHDIGLPDFDAVSDSIAGKGNQTQLIFKADREGVFAYYCTIPGHRQAGMEGKLVVGDPQLAAKAIAASQAVAASIVGDPADVPAPIGNRGPQTVRVGLEAVELEGQLADGSTYTYWTFNGTVPGPFLRVRVGDQVEVHLKNAADSAMAHSVDFHAVTGPGGGAAVTQTAPGQETQFTFKALNPGLYVYHCATPMVAHHLANGMYGLILVEPEGGLPEVDHEFYVMQGEIYTEQPFGAPGALTFSQEKLLNETPEYYVFNGAVGALTETAPLKAQVGETVRIFFGVGGPNRTSSFHVIGEILDRVYDQASLTSAPLTDVQTILVPAGGAAMVEFTLEVPGRYILVDHALSRLERGLAGYLLVEGPDQPEIFSGTPSANSGH